MLSEDGRATVANVGSLGYSIWYFGRLYCQSWVIDSRDAVVKVRPVQGSPDDLGIRVILHTE